MRYLAILVALIFVLPTGIALPEQVITEYINNHFVFYVGEESNQKEVTITFLESRMEQDLLLSYVKVESEGKKGYLAFQLDPLTEQIVSVGYQKPEAKGGTITRIVRNGISFFTSLISPTPSA